MPDHGAVLHAALGRMLRVTGLPVAFGGAASGGGQSVRLTEFAGTRTGALRGLVITAGNGLGGRVLVTVRPGSVDDYAADAQISHEYDKPVTAEGLRAIAAVPVVAAGSVAAVLYGGIREPLPLGTRLLDAMSQVAARAGIELAVESEVGRRLTALETTAITTAAREARAAPEWEQVREAHAELRSIARQVTDPVLRRRLEAVCDRLTRPHGRPAPGNPLSPRELDVLALVAVGCGNAEVGRRLGLLPETVKSYLRNAMSKLGTHSRMETVVAARHGGYLP
ncbi:MAG: helix-turn-helix transcriptional regulator [Streptosporangiaceae bacterium]|nr:helix-turn-helix transcriptional regulator [Streptosporangiaceae bacterium]